jgi:hypothetical protein
MKPGKEPRPVRIHGEEDCRRSKRQEPDPVQGGLVVAGPERAGTGTEDQTVRFARRLRLPKLHLRPGDLLGRPEAAEWNARGDHLLRLLADF